MAPSKKKRNTSTVTAGLKANEAAEASETALTVPVRQPWARFDAAKREAFLNAIRSGVSSRRSACRLIKLNYSTLTKWLEVGKKADHSSHNAGSRRAFYVDLLAAEAERDARIEMVIFTAAKTEWRAAAAFGQIRERQSMAPLTRRKKLAEIEEAEAKAGYAKVLVEKLERELRPSKGSIYWPADFLKMCEPNERAVIEAAMARLGFHKATAEDVVAQVANRSPEEERETQAFSDRWKRRDQLGAAAEVWIRRIESTQSPGPTTHDDSALLHPEVERLVAASPKFLEYLTRTDRRGSDLGMTVSGLLECLERGAAALEGELDRLLRNLARA